MFADTIALESTDGKAAHTPADKPEAFFYTGRIVDLQAV